MVLHTFLLLTILSGILKEKSLLRPNWWPNCQYKKTDMAPVPDNPAWVKALKPAGPQGHELLKAERAKSDLNSTRVAHFLHGKEELKRRDQMLELLEAEKVFDKSQNYFEGRIDRFKTSLARAKRLQQLNVKHGWSREDFALANELLSESTPYRLHDSMFLV